MRRLVLLLSFVPLAVFAQVEIDTIIRLPVPLRGGPYLQGRNKLYLASFACDQYLVLDCSTYQLKAQIPFEGAAFYQYSYNWRRQKLYITFGETPESTLVIDADGDSILRWLDVYREFRSDVYLSDLDVRFKPAVDTLYEYECDADTIARRWPIHSTWGSWDSVHRKLYVGQGSQKKLYVYDYLADSCLKTIDVSSVYAQMPDACVFSHNYHRAYVAHGRFDMVDDEVGIIDTERDTLVRVLPVKLEEGVYRHVAVDERDGKAYITSYPDTMWVVDCATDSVLKKFECGHGGYADLCIRWVPWSNRIYVAKRLPDTLGRTSLVVIDCNTDSVIVPGTCLSDQYIQDIQLDPVRQRVFVIGDYVYVLRDTGYAAVQETPGAGGRAMNVSPTIVCGVLFLTEAAGRKPQAASLIDAAGRKVLDLKPGANDVRALAPGVYFVRTAQAQAQAQAIRKVVLAR